MKSDSCSREGGIEPSYLNQPGQSYSLSIELHQLIPSVPFHTQLCLMQLRETTGLLEMKRIRKGGEAEMGSADSRKHHLATI